MRTAFLTTTRIWTLREVAACGLWLQEGTEIVVSGQLRGSLFYVYQCGFSNVWSYVNDDVKQGLMGGYKCT